MIASGALVATITTHGIAILAPLAVLEGPIVTVIAAYLASIGLLPLWQVILCVIVADLVGDAILYSIGRGTLRWLPVRFRERLGISEDRLAHLALTFQDNGARVLIIGKLTHAAGFAILIGAGAARMHFLTFLLSNLVATIPKSLILVAIGMMFGSQHALIADYLSRGSGVLVVLALSALGIWFYRRRKALA